MNRFENVFQNIILRQINKYFKEITTLILRNFRFRELLKKDEYMYNKIKTLKIINDECTHVFDYNCESTMVNLKNIENLILKNVQPTAHGDWKKEFNILDWIPENTLRKVNFKNTGDIEWEEIIEKQSNLTKLKCKMNPYAIHSLNINNITYLQIVMKKEISNYTFERIKKAIEPKRLTYKYNRGKKTIIGSLTKVNLTK